jgi:acetoin utilization protein AcuB
MIKMIKRSIAMNTLFVRDCMVPNPITITPQTTLTEARQLMEKQYIRRLPVIKKGKLVGIVTRSDIREAQTSYATSLRAEDLNFVLDRLVATYFMAYEPITISPDATIAEAATLMLRHQVGGLPVVENDEVVGIITETDLCRLWIRQPANMVGI